MFAMFEDNKDDDEDSTKEIPTLVDSVLNSIYIVKNPIVIKNRNIALLTTVIFSVLLHHIE